MFNISFSVSNPFSSRFENVSMKHGLLEGHKAWEANLYKTNVIFSFGFRLAFRQDHAGVSVEIGLFGYELEAQLYDTRHWDDETNSWVVYD